MYEKEKKISFQEAKDVNEFVCAADGCDFDIDVYCNRMVVDAKSILAMHSIGVQRQLVVRYGGTNENFENIIAKFAIVS